VCIFFHYFQIKNGKETVYTYLQIDTCTTRSRPYTVVTVFGDLSGQRGRMKSWKNENPVSCICSHPKSWPATVMPNNHDGPYTFMCWKTLKCVCNHVLLFYCLWNHNWGGKHDRITSTSVASFIVQYLKIIQCQRTNIYIYILKVSCPYKKCSNIILRFPKLNFIYWFLSPRSEFLYYPSSV